MPPRLSEVKPMTPTALDALLRVALASSQAGPARAVPSRCAAGIPTPRSSRPRSWRPSRWLLELQGLRSDVGHAAVRNLNVIEEAPTRRKRVGRQTIA